MVNYGSASLIRRKKGGVLDRMKNVWVNMGCAMEEENIISAQKPEYDTRAICKQVEEKGYAMRMIMERKGQTHLPAYKRVSDLSRKARRAERDSRGPNTLMNFNWDTAPWSGSYDIVSKKWK